MARRVGVVFDIDGTLADSFELGFSATNTVLRRRGYAAVDAAAYHEGCVYVTPERLSRHAVGSYDEALGADLGREFDDTYIALVDRETAGFYPGIGALLDRLVDCGAPVGALTNAAVEYAEAVLVSNNHRGKFMSVHGADSVPAPKPFGDGCLQVADELGLEPRDCVYVGDAATDGAAARAAGFGAAIGCAYGSHAKEKLVACGHFDVVADDVAGVANALFSGAGDDGERLARVLGGD